MSPPGRPKGEYRSAQREGFPVHPPGRPKGEYRSAQREGIPVSPPGRPKGEYRSARSAKVFLCTRRAAPRANTEARSAEDCNEPRRAPAPGRAVRRGVQRGALGRALVARGRSPVPRGRGRRVLQRGPAHGPRPAAAQPAIRRGRARLPGGDRDTGSGTIDPRGGQFARRLPRPVRISPGVDTGDRHRPRGVCAPEDVPPDFERDGETTRLLMVCGRRKTDLAEVRRRPAYGMARPLARMVGRASRQAQHIAQSWRLRTGRRGPRRGRCASSNSSRRSRVPRMSSSLPDDALVPCSVRVDRTDGSARRPRTQAIAADFAADASRPASWRPPGNGSFAGALLSALQGSPLDRRYDDPDAAGIAAN